MSPARIRLAPNDGPKRYDVVEYDAANLRRSGVFEHSDGVWTSVAGDSLEPILRKRISGRGRRHLWRRMSRRGWAKLKHAAWLAR